MKKIIFAILIYFGLIIIQSCNKEDITSNEYNNFEVSFSEAQIIAENFIQPKTFQYFFPEQKNIDKSNFNHKKQKKFTNNKVDTILIEVYKHKTVFFKINYKKGGFLILSADKRVEPILAYSFINTIPINQNAYPPGFKIWIEYTKKQIDEIKTTNVGINIKAQNSFNYLIEPNIIDPIDPPCESSSYIVGPLLTTQWGQGCGYNNYMPQLSCGPCGHALAGCVMVATAQIMNYYEYPTNYNWNYMPDLDGNNFVSNLIVDIWDYIPSNVKYYNCLTGTGVDIDYDFSNIFKNGFNYTNATQSSYNYLTVKSNLNNHKPILLMGTGDNGGHAWVCDGYRNFEDCIETTDPYTGEINYTYISYLYLHMNWGWNGDADGYYAFNNFNPLNTTFNNNVKMVCNINP